MIRQQKSIYLFFVLLLLAGAGGSCSSMQRYLDSCVVGESTDGQHSQWIDETGADAGIDVAPEAEADPEVAGESSELAESLGSSSLDPSIQDTSLGRSIESGSITFDLIESAGGGTQGQLLKLTITNPSEEEIIFEIPAGLVLTPDNSGEQDLMVLDGDIVILQPGETIVLSPYVVCIEASAAAPSAGSGYQIGYLASGDLLTFSVCVDEQVDGPLDPEDIGLQFAAWSIAGGGNIFDISNLSELEEGAFSGMIDEWEAMPGMLETMQTMVSGFSDEWLQRCEITIESEE